MSTNSTIEWTDATWNPVTGCVEVSPGCDRCYAKTFAERFRGTPGHCFEQWGEWRPQPRYATDDRHHLVQLDGVDRGTPWPGWGLDQPDAAVMERVGKKRAGRELDDRTWDEFPQIAALTP